MLRKGAEMTTKTATHTPGKWEIVTRLSGSENHRGFIARDERGHWISDISPRDSDGLEGQANARLIAACPQMLEALEACIEWEESYRTINNLGLEPPYPFEQAKAAIRSAKGEL
jgi:hypothetical protein